MNDYFLNPVYEPKEWDKITNLHPPLKIKQGQLFCLVNVLVFSNYCYRIVKIHACLK